MAHRRTPNNSARRREIDLDWLNLTPDVPIPAEQYRAAALRAAAAVLSHPCQATPISPGRCSHPRHDQDREDLRRLLDMLGMLDPGTGTGDGAEERDTQQPAPHPVPNPPQRRRRRTATDWSWTDWAACKGEDLSLFFGAEGERPPARDAREERARRYCRICPVRRQCLEHAVAGYEWGFWGGTSENDRIKIRRSRTRQRNQQAQGLAS